MRSPGRWLLLPAFAIAGARAQDHAVHHRQSARQDAAQIVVTINPEARVSAVIGAPLPAPPSCGTPMELEVDVINQGFVTAPLRAAIVGDGNRHVALSIDDVKLSGAPEDARVLRLLPRTADLVDVTIAFSVDANPGDLGERDRVHVLVRCVGASTE